MNFKRILLPLGLVLLAGCQKSSQNEVTGTMESASTKCIASPTDISAGNVKILGNSVSQSGDVAKYSLVDSSGCAVDSQNISWKVTGASSAESSSASLTSVYKRAGLYVVTAQDTTSSSSVPLASLKTTVVSNDISLSGPQVGFVFSEINYSLVVPASLKISSVEWNFGDASAPVSNSNSATHIYLQPGVYQIQVSLTDSNGQVTNLAQKITILNLVDGMTCLPDLAITGATEAKINASTSVSVYLPSCLTGKVGAIHWNFGDNQSASGQNVSHTYTALGTYPVTATLYLGSSQDPWLTLDYSIHVIENLDTQDPSTPADPLACTKLGDSRTTQGDLYSENAACGINGTKSVTYRDQIKEECQLVGEKLQWKEVSRSKEITNEGPCQGQSCKLPDGSLLADGASKVLYSNASPVGACTSVSESRTCNNSVLSGSSSSNQMVCHDGCGSFGPHGTVVSSVVTGEAQVPRVCAFGEQGFFDTFNQVSDQTCQDGALVNSNTRQGSLKTAGQCPTYSYVPTENFTSCSADCGGKQTRIFVCQDNKGAVADSSRCKDSMPVEERLCDGNPAAVARSESSTSTEEANSSSLCPANQIGVIAKSRDIVTTKEYACIDHQIQLANETTTPGAWVEEKFCRDYVAHRCSQDSISNQDAKGRYDWMVKCQDQLPVVKEFLTKFADVSITLNGQKISVGSNSREIYPTFMDTSTKPERPWIAPKSAKADCVMPRTAYIATVCVSSCATPEQQILAQEKASGKLQYTNFIDALTKNYAFVASLQSESSMSDKRVVKTKVDQWVTELIDTEHDILVFKMKSGRELKITPNHPVLTQDGTMKTAGEFKAGEALVQLGGVLDPILSITPIKYFGKVYNVFVQSNAVHKNILVTNGYLNGSAFFQNAGAVDLNRALFKAKLTKGVFEQ